RCPRDSVADQEHLHVRPGSRRDLHDPPGAGARARVRLEARLHPGEALDERTADAVMASPEIQRGADGAPFAAESAFFDLRDGHHAEGLERLSPDDPVYREAASALVVAHGPLGGVREMAVHPAGPKAARSEEELEHRDVPADHAPPDEQAPTEEGFAEAAELRARERPGDTVNRQAGVPLEAAHAPGGQRARYAVDLTGVETLR